MPIEKITLYKGQQGDNYTFTRDNPIVKYEFYAFIQKKYKPLYDTSFGKSGVATINPQTIRAIKAVISDVSPALKSDFINNADKYECVYNSKSYFRLDFIENEINSYQIQVILYETE